MSALAILDLGYGNVESVRLGFVRLGAEPVLVRDRRAVENAERLVVPGVGHAGYAMERLEAHGLVDALKARVRPTLGICVGMQLLFEASDECERPLLGLLPGRVAALSSSPTTPVPHMGWTRVKDVAAGVGLEQDEQLYFAHSFAAPESPYSVASMLYAGRHAAAVRKDNLWGAQFHPERSSAPGARYLEAFLAS
ncbi:imidazole glycerol phosphate synthase subunit HisH [Sphingomicrobium nitratireducens]|uniref:imidazole glycerol phosphate synthase subunit HisH n=1 Tax=Sphingomicrobium nitratireducens TaxID=2964666 RepID=UPI00224005B0